MGICHDSPSSLMTLSCKLFENANKAQSRSFMGIVGNLRWEINVYAFGMEEVMVFYVKLQMQVKFVFDLHSQIMCYLCAQKTVN